MVEVLVVNYLHLFVGTVHLQRILSEEVSIIIINFIIILILLTA